MKQNNNIQISVIVATYNTTFDRLKHTLKSIVLQKGINFEILIADDGSKNNWLNDTENLFMDLKFQNYKFFPSDVNNGTCLNLYRVLYYAHGTYIKPISPGDYLYSSDTLANWYEFVIKNNIKVSFGDSVYYAAENKDLIVLDKRKAPVLSYSYDLNKYRSYAIKTTIFLFIDAILGASVLFEKELFVNYLKIVIEAGVKLGEDFSLRLMILDNIPIIHFPQNVIWYEFGLGVSTSHDSYWNKAMFHDLQCMWNIEQKLNKKDFFYKKYRFFIKFLYRQKLFDKLIRNGLKIILFPEFLFWKIIKAIKIRFTKSDYNPVLYEIITK